MSSTKNSKPAKPDNKEARHTIEKKLDLLLVDLKQELGDSKFRNRIKKAAKLLSKGLDKKKKPAAVNKKAAKKATPAAVDTASSTKE